LRRSLFEQAGAQLAFSSPINAEDRAVVWDNTWTSKKFGSGSVLSATRRWVVLQEIISIFVQD
jgi:hypothetical protein